VTAPTAAPAPAPADPQPAVYRDRTFLGYLGAHGVSLVGMQIWFVTLGWSAAQLGDPGVTALVLAAGSVPRAALLLLGGALVDRLGVRRLMVGGDLARAAVMAAAAVLVLGFSPGPVLLTAVAFTFGVVDAAYLPAASSMPRLLLPTERLPAGLGLGQAVSRTTVFLGAPLGGVVAAVGGLALAGGLNTALFGLSALALARLRVRRPVDPSPGSSVWRDVGSGLAYVAREPLLRTVLLAVTLLNFASIAPFNVGLALRAENEGWGATGLGWLVAAFGLGALGGSLALVRGRGSARPAVTGLVWVVVQGACCAAIGVAPGLGVALVAALAAGVTAGPASVLLLGLVQARTEAAYLGRVMSLSTFASLGTVPVAYAAFGVLAQVWGVTAAFVLCGALEAAVAVVALASREVRCARLG